MVNINSQRRTFCIDLNERKCFRLKFVTKVYEYEKIVNGYEISWFDKKPKACWAFKYNTKVDVYLKFHSKNDEFIEKISSDTSYYYQNHFPLKKKYFFDTTNLENYGEVLRKYW